MQWREFMYFNIKMEDTGYYYKFAGNPIKLVKGLLEENGFKET